MNNNRFNNRSTFYVLRSGTKTIKTGSTFNVKRSTFWNLNGFYLTVALSLAFLFGGCTLAKVDVNVVSERTSLENQVLGTYNALSEDVLLVASVRGVSPTGKVDAPQKHSPEHQEAAQALEAIAFHADDVDTFKRLGWVGESLQGTLTPFERALPEKAPADLKAFAARFSAGEFKQVVDEVNRSREILMLRVVRTNENFTAKDLPAIRKVFARINRQNSAPGTRVQGDDGHWVNQ